MNASLSQQVQIPADSGLLEGMLELPPNARGVVVFAHGSGSSRLSPRNNVVAEKLREGRVGTLLVDLLLTREESVYETRFDIPLLTRRLATVLPPPYTARFVRKRRARHLYREAIISGDTNEKRGDGAGNQSLGIAGGPIRSGRP